MSSDDVCRVKLTAGNIRNHHFYLRGCESVIPEGGLGGRNKDTPGRPFTVRFEPGPTVETDVDGAKMILTDRKAVRAFLESAAASEGDVVCLQRIGDRQIVAWLELNSQHQPTAGRSRPLSDKRSAAG